MATIDVIARRVDTAEDLRAIVKTMKALAAASIRQYEEAVASLDEYARTVERGLQALLHARPDLAPRPGTASTPERVAAVVVGSDHGLCGAFNEHVTSFYVEGRAGAAPVGEDRLIALGVRAAGRLEEMGLRPARVFALPASVTGIAALVGDVLERVAAWRADDAVDAVAIYFNGPRGSTGYQPQVVRLLPIDDAHLRRLAAIPWRPRALPMVAGDWQAVFAAIVRQHLFVTLHRAVTLSLASEHASRLTAMQAAERNIDERLQTLRSHYHRERQAAITTELIDIVSGYEALTDSRGGNDDRGTPRRLAT